jgi:DNA primase
VDEAQNDPVKKAGLIRDMVTSIAKIPDRIQREIYIQECARIMDISEQVLSSTLAQLIQKDIADTGKKMKEEQRDNASVPLSVEKSEEEQKKVAILYLIENKIIEILLLYGNREYTFEDAYVKFDEFNKEYIDIEKKDYKVYERIYLSLQEDEIEFANDSFKRLYKELIPFYLNDITKSIDLNYLPQDLQSIASGLIMEDDKYLLSGWEEKQQIPVKQKTENVDRLTDDNLTALRWLLLGKLNNSLKFKVLEPNADPIEIMTEIRDYNQLINFFSRTKNIIRINFYED